MTFLLVALLLQGAAPEKPTMLDPAVTDQEKLLVPAGTVIPVNLTSRISTKNAQEGDGIYAQTAIPITFNNEIVIPAGSFVRGKIARVEQPGRIKGRAEMTFNFQSLILPSGVTLEIYASLGGTGGAIERKGEATVVADKGDDGEEVLENAAAGAGVGAATGAIYRGAGGALQGAAIGAGVSVAGAALIALIRRGDPLVLEPGTLIEIVLDRPIPR